MTNHIKTTIAIIMMCSGTLVATSARAVQMRGGGEAASSYKTWGAWGSHLQDAKEAVVKADQAIWDGHLGAVIRAAEAAGISGALLRGGARGAVVGGVLGLAAAPVTAGISLWALPLITAGIGSLTGHEVEYQHAQAEHKRAQASYDAQSQRATALQKPALQRR